MMQTIWDTAEEEKKRRMMMGAPLEGIQYRQADGGQQPAPVQERKGPDSIGTTAQKIMVNRGINQGLDYGIKKAGQGVEYGVDKAKEAYMDSIAPKTPDSQYIAQNMENGSGAPLAETNVTNPMDYSAAPAVAPADTAAATLAENTPAGDVTSGMVDATAAPLSDVATNAATDAVAEGATQVATDAATSAATEAASTAVAEGAASAAVEGSAGSVAGPLAGGIELVKTGDVGKASGKAAGAYAGAALGSFAGPIGTFVGGAIGSYLGGELGGYLT